MHYPTHPGAAHRGLRTTSWCSTACSPRCRRSSSSTTRTSTTCGSSAYLGTKTDAELPTGRDANCLWNTQSLINRTTRRQSRSLLASYQTRRYTYEAKTDGTYFLTHMLGGDHSLKFGLGCKKAPILSFSHYSGGARANVQCVGNPLRTAATARCRPARRPASSRVRRSSIATWLRNNDWWSYNGYLQDSFSRGRWRLNGGLRWDWQQSKFLGGCVPANELAPDAAAGTVRGADRVDPHDRQEDPGLRQLVAARIGHYDLFGNGKTSLHASASVLLRASALPLPTASAA